MPAAAVVTLILVGITVLVIAGYLLVIAVSLIGVSSTLGKVVSSVNEIPSRTQPVPSVVDAMSKDLGDAANLLESLLQKKAGPSPSPRPQRVTGSTSPGPDNLW